MPRPNGRCDALDTRETLAGDDAQLLSRGVTGQRQWYVNRAAHTMVVIPGPASFLMGSARPLADQAGEERLHSRWIPHGFSIANKETSVAQFQAFLADSRPPDRPAVAASASDADAPQGDVNWFEAAAYCNWLSAREGIPTDQWCYTSSSDASSDLLLRPKPGCLELRGYRLPTEAEWEYACRAGTDAPRYFGDSESLLERYATVRSPSVARPLPAASKKPNDFGLFDMYGNVAEWCHDAYRPYPQTDVLQASSDTESGEPVTDATRAPFAAARGKTNPHASAVPHATSNPPQPACRHSASAWRGRIRSVRGVHSVGGLNRPADGTSTSEIRTGCFGDQYSPAGSLPSAR